MEQYDLWKLDKKLQKEVDEDRYHHTLGVMFTAASMAMVWGEDLEKARVAGLLHDCAKCIPNKKKITMCEKNKIEITEFERNNPFLIHAKLGAFLAKDKYKVEDLKCHHLAYDRKRRYDIAGEDHLYRRLYRAGTKQGTAPYPPSEAGIHRYRRMHV